MEHREKPSSDEAVVEALLRRARYAMTKLRRQWGWVVNSDVWADIEQEARLTLWKALPRLKSLPTEEQESYAACCVRRAAVRALRPELKHKRRTVFIEDLSPHERDAFEQLHEGETEKTASFLLEDLLNFDDLLLTDAFEALSSTEWVIVIFSVFFDWSDAEVADLLNTNADITPAAVTKRRQRALAKMRTFIEKSGGGGG